MPPLQASDDETWLAALGVMPQTETVSGDEFVREVTVPIADTEELQITWDKTDSSVRVRHRQRGDLVADLYREMVVQLTAVGTGSAGEVIIDYGSDGWVGRTRVQVLPEVCIEDTVLRS